MSDTPTTSGPPPRREMTDEQYNAKFTKDAIRNAAARLRRMAEDVERLTISVDKVGNPGFASYGQVAAEVVSEVRNGLFNLHVENVVTYASQADIARAEAKAADQ